MMWWVFNKLFGWQYVSIRSLMMDYRYIRRVYLTKNQEPYIVFTSGNIWFLLPDGKVDNGYEWRSLT